jgi:hypothetical protein
VSLAIKYETPDDAKLRLRNTVVLYKGEPVLINDVARGEGKDDILRVLFQPLPTPGVDRFGRRQPDPEAMERKYISSKHFDIAPFRMGYVNDQKLGAFFCSRLPNRVQKQGLCTENFKGVTNNVGGIVNFATFLSNPNVVDMVHNRYPSIDEAIRGLAKSPAVAFHREFCVMKDEVIPDLIYLYHKGQKVGMYSKGEKKVQLGNKFNCLKESLEELKLKVGGF